MRLATIQLSDRTSAARIEGDDAILIPATDLGVLLARPDWMSLAEGAGPRVPLESTMFLPVVPHPNKVICIGLNYLSHIKEGLVPGEDPPAHPNVFSKFDGALTGAYDDIVKPDFTDQLDWEAELAFVVGAEARNVSRAHALQYVAGYTVANDVSLRDVQMRANSQWLMGKTLEKSTPIGPWLVTPDELPPGASGLRISATLDGVVYQDARTDDLLFDVAAIIEDLTRFITLLPGDIVLTGTPAGVGMGQSPYVWMQPGQTIEVEIEGIGALRNRVVGS